jgi:hypothetical protein
MTHPNRRRLADEWAVIRRRLDDGVPMSRIARDYGVPEGVVRYLAACDGRISTFAARPRPDGKGWLKPSIERRVEAVALRESGLILEEVGRRMGITRERARQLIVLAGRSDLNKDFTKKMGLARTPLVTYACAACGKTKNAARSRVRRYCSSRCAARPRNFIIDRAPIIIAMRRAGHTWQDIGEHFETGWTGLHQALKRLAAQTGLDVSGVFGVYHGNHPNNRRAA